MLKCFPEALADYKRAIELAPGYLLALQNQAWLLTICENSELRDSLVAIEAAKKVDEATQYKEISQSNQPIDPALLETTSDNEAAASGEASSPSP